LEPYNAFAMNTASKLIPWIAVCALLCGSPAFAADTTASATRIPIAHSALLTIDATETDDSLTLRIRHVTDQTPVNSPDVTLSVDGKNVPLAPQADGTYVASAKDLRGNGERVLDIVVGHDGIREILTGKLAAPEASPTASLLREHKQMAWWILNIAVVLIAAIALSRRMS
jgi:hypothetical protein